MPALPDEQIRTAVAARQDELIGFCQRLIQAPSLPDQERAAQEIVAERLGAMGLQVEILPVCFDRLRDHPAFGDDGFSPGGRIDVIGRWHGTGGGRSLILNGHVDVVSPGDPALWTDSPWSGTLRDRRLWGRGSCDMKGGLASGIFALVVLQDLGWSPGGDIVVESVIGEESGGAGTLATIVEGIRADGAIILEPTRLELCPVQSGALTFRLTVAGQAAHGAMRQRGVSAIEKFALLHAALLELERARHAGRAFPLYDDPEWVAPLSIGTVQGGEWHSTVAETVTAEGRFGVFPGESVTEARRGFEQAVADAAGRDPWLAAHPPRVDWFEGQFESGATPTDHPLIATLGAAHQRVLNRSPRLRGVPYGSDLRLFTNHAGMAAVLYGPGDVALAHAVNESIEVTEILEAVAVLAAAIMDWCGSA
ncbi:MAG TPA: ArgE/DapE family deacylase [Gemmatimonadales bacterium]